MIMRQFLFLVNFKRVKKVLKYHKIDEKRFLIKKALNF